VGESMRRVRKFLGGSRFHTRWNSVVHQNNEDESDSPFQTVIADNADYVNLRISEIYSFRVFLVKVFEKILSCAVFMSFIIFLSFIP
ncbi:hypothetical protein, partial [Fibrobacter sp.]|uniref:hypothetical protein n=1 Tax=Fibrobacter sp. TaxID=35828 RepID=UPI00386AC192